MNMTTKKDIFLTRLPEWLKARGDKKLRGGIALAVSMVTGLHLKSVSRSFRRAQMRDHGLTETRGRPVVYGTCVTAALRTVWEAGGEPCGENLHPLIAEIVMILRRDGDWEHPESATRGLLRMSEGTVKARVSAFERTRWSCRGKSTTKPGSILSLVPVRADGWKNAPAGTLQIDTVAHCGGFHCGGLCVHGERHGCPHALGDPTRSVEQRAGGDGPQHGGDGRCRSISRRRVAS